jgi:transcriptional regulator with XRE-family HTH domain
MLLWPDPGLGTAYERGPNTPSTDVSIKLADIFDVLLDYLVFEAEGQAAKVNIKDRELLRRFEKIDKLSEKDKRTIKKILDTLILKNKFQSLAAPEQL